MAHFTDLTGLAGIACAIAAATLLLPQAARPNRSRMAIMQAAVFTLALIPLGAMPIAAYVRGITGDLSITTLVLLGCALSRPWCNCAAGTTQRQALLLLIALLALALYPMALGLGAFDPYRLGYGDPRLIAALLLIALLAWLRRFNLIALCIALAVLAWAAGWYESNNLWDYLLDPFAAIYALSTMTISAVQRFFPLRQGPT
jgi:MYXO-CTERM domain-containing protein